MPILPRTQAITRRAHKLLQELNFPEELVVNTSIEKLAAYIPAVLKQDEEE